MIAAAAGTSCLRSTPLAVRVLFPPPAQPANEAARRSTADFAASAARAGGPDDGRLSGRFTQAHYSDTGLWPTTAGTGPEAREAALSPVSCRDVPRERRYARYGCRGVRSVRRGDAARRRNSSGSGIPPVK